MARGRERRRHDGGADPPVRQERQGQGGAPAYAYEDINYLMPSNGRISRAFGRAGSYDM